MHKPKRLTAGVITVCLDTSKANDESYPNWVTYRLDRAPGSAVVYKVWKLSNASGNGQTWQHIGFIRAGELELFSTGLNNPVAIGCATQLARYFGFAFSHTVGALFPRARVFRPRGRKTAAPSLLGPVRDKNRNRAHETAKAITVAEMRARLAR
jgi:hypothetical protein